MKQMLLSVVRRQQTLLQRIGGTHYFDSSTTILNFNMCMCFYGTPPLCMLLTCVGCWHVLLDNVLLIVRCLRFGEMLGL